MTRTRYAGAVIPMASPSRPGQAALMITMAAVLILVIIAHDSAAQEQAHHPDAEVQVFVAGSTVGTLVLPVPVYGLAGVVLLLQDTDGTDPRAALYIDQLIGARIAVVNLLPGDSDGVALRTAVQALATDVRLAGAPIGVVGFGSGARAALTLPAPVAARALLYPGCATLDPSAVADDRLLLLHGGDDVANPREACAALAVRLADGVRAVRHIVYPSAGYAWDYPPYTLQHRVLLPRPDGAGRIPSQPWPELAVMSAAQVADFFGAAFAALIP